MQQITRRDELPRGGKCTGKDPSIWFPLADRSQPGNFSANYRKAMAHTRLAKQICGECSIRYECLAYSIYHEMYGIWGGLTERERHMLRVKMNIKLVPREPVNLLLSSSQQRKK